MAQRVGGCCGQIAACTVTAQDHRSIAILKNRAGGSDSIIKHRRMSVFRCQPIGQRQHIQTGRCTDFAAYIVMAVQPANNKTAPVKIDNSRPHCLPCMIV